jgi:hypothetical protein
VVVVVVVVSSPFWLDHLHTLLSTRSPHLFSHSHIHRTSTEQERAKGEKEQKGEEGEEGKERQTLENLEPESLVCLNHSNRRQRGGRLSRDFFFMKKERKKKKTAML